MIEVDFDIFVLVELCKTLSRLQKNASKYEVGDDFAIKLRFSTYIGEWWSVKHEFIESKWVDCWSFESIVYETEFGHRAQNIVQSHDWRVELDTFVIC